MVSSYNTSGAKETILVKFNCLNSRMIAPKIRVPLETRIKVVDFLAPYHHRGKIGLFGGAGVDKIVIIMELINNIAKAHIGDVIVAVIKEVVPNMPLEISEVIKVIIVRTYKELKRNNGMIIRYDDNVVVIIDQEGNPKGTQIFGAIVPELRQLNFTKIVSIWR